MSHNGFWKNALDHLLLQGELETFSTGAIKTLNSLTVLAEHLTGIVNTSQSMLSDLTGYKKNDIKTFLDELEDKRVINRIAHDSHSEYSLHPRLFEETADIEVLG